MAGNLSAWLAANKTEAIGVGAVAVAGLALVARKRNGATSTGTTAGAVAPGTIPAASVVGATADSSAFDAYNALQDEIGTLARNSEAAHQTGATGSGVGAAVKGPIASNLLAPSGSGHLVRYGTGIYEVESDGSLYKESLGEWGAQGSPSNYVQLGSALPSGLTPYSSAANLQHQILTGASAAAQTSGA